MVEDAVVDVLKRWLPTYLAEVERQSGLATAFYPRPRSWEVRNEMEKWPEEQLPSIIVISTGLAGTPLKEGGGQFRVPWAIGVAAVVSAKDALSTRRMAYRYAAAIRALLIHRQSLDQALGGAVRGVNWLDGRNNEMPVEAGRTIWASRQVFSVDVGGVLTANAGPVTPADPQPDPNVSYEEWPTIPDLEHIVNTYTKEPIDG